MGARPAVQQGGGAPPRPSKRPVVVRQTLLASVAAAAVYTLVTLYYSSLQPGELGTLGRPGGGVNAGSGRHRRCVCAGQTGFQPGMAHHSPAQRVGV